MKIKRERMEDIINQYKSTISIQVLNELSNVMSRKMKLSVLIVENVIEEISSICEVVAIEINTIKLALRISDKYKYSYYDSLILASALENGCSIVFTEDMQNGQIVEEFLSIINPFR